MIVKNEEKVIQRCLQSVNGLIDGWLICDTGSSDRTKEIIRDLPGSLVERPWKDFGSNRTELMEMARHKADYLLMLDADMTVQHADGVKSRLEGDSFLIRYTGDVEFRQKLLVSGQLEWHYVGVTHEYICTGDPEMVGRCDEITVTHHADGGMRADKFERDVRLLLDGLKEEPENLRYVFYLAQSYRNLCRWDDAIKYYQQRVEMGGWAEEVFFSLYHIGLITADHFGDWPGAQSAFIKAWEFRPHRLEPIYELVIRFRKRKEYHEAYALSKPALRISYPDNDILFIQRWIYTYGLLFEHSICSYWVGDFKGSIEACDRVLMCADTPDHIRKQTIINRNYSLKKLGIQTGAP